MKNESEGNFSTLGFEENDAKYLQDAYDAITKLNLWKELSEYTPTQGFMFSSSPFVEKIRSEMKFMSAHSGSSYGWTMRQMEFIAKHGWNKYIELNNIII